MRKPKPGCVQNMILAERLDYWQKHQASFTSRSGSKAYRCRLSCPT